jgi:hypothetical protein
MSELGASSRPVLADPVILPRPPVPVGLVPAGVAVGGFLFAACWFLIPDMSQAARYIPRSTQDLGPGVVTPVDARNPAAVRVAISALNVPRGQRQEIERDVLAGRRRIGWIVVTDSMDPDGDMIAIEAGGVSQTVTLTKAWMPIPVLLDDAHMIGITAVKDGVQGGVTLALATHGSQLTLRPMEVGERIEVAAP